MPAPVSGVRTPRSRAAVPHPRPDRREPGQPALCDRYRLRAADPKRRADRNNRSCSACRTRIFRRPGAAPYLGKHNRRTSQRWSIRTQRVRFDPELRAARTKRRSLPVRSATYVRPRLVHRSSPTARRSETRPCLESHPQRKSSLAASRFLRSAQGSLGIRSGIARN